MGGYFKRIEGLSKNMALDSRHRFMLQVLQNPACPDL